MAKNILPDVDLLNSREYYGAYNSRDFQKGTSIEMSGEWQPGVHYFNDEYYISFTSYQGALLSCKRSHIANSNNEPKLITQSVGGFDVVIGIEQSNYWNFVLAGTPGKDGRIYIPSYDSETGNLSWTVSDNPGQLSPMHIKGDPGTSVTNISDSPLYQNGKNIGVRVNIEYGDNNETFDVLHGDENIHIGSTPPMNPDGTIDTSKIWIDFDDDTVGPYEAIDIVYTSYLEAGGTLTKDGFIKAFSSLNETSGFDVKFAESYEQLPKPTADRLGELWMIPSKNSETTDLYEEYIVVSSPATPTKSYMWERWGSGSLNVSLEDYYTKDQVNQVITEKIESIDSTSFNGGEDDASSWPI